MPSAGPAVLLLFLACVSSGPGEPRASAPLARACAYLWERQGADGGWHSETYGVLRGGQALTPFVLHALLEAPEKVCPAPSGGLERALAFIRAKTSPSGVLGVADPDILEYPNYATSYAILCLLRAGRGDDRDLIARMRGYLASEQYRPESGFEPGSPAYGGFGFGGKRPPGSPGHMDLSHTRRALKALRAAGLDDPALDERALAFLGLLQRNQDGGFYFSPVELDANKGGEAPAEGGSSPQYRSYATATCDGTLALLHAGLSRTDGRVAAARGWLERHPRLDYPEGVPPGGPVPWGESIRFYHLAVRAEVYDALGWPERSRARLLDILEPRQRPDGSFSSDHHLMKEDDPLLATALAVIALTRAAR